MRQEQVEGAYDYCRRVTRHASKTFYWGSMFLPPPKRQAIWAVYAFCRVVDDIVDEACGIKTVAPGHLVGVSDPEAALAYWRESLERMYRSGSAGGIMGGPIQLAWSHMLDHYNVPLEPALDLLQGVAMDLNTPRYNTFDELYVYCYRVAGTVGLLTSPIFGYLDESALPYAVDLGVALQLTNILRDIGEDARRDRIYLPLDEMQRFGYSEADLLAGVMNESFRALVHYQIERADDYYRRAQPGIAMLNSDCRLAVRLSGSLYRNILERIRLNNYNVFTKRASVPLKTKLAAIPQNWYVQRMEMRAKG